MTDTKPTVEVATPQSKPGLRLPINAIIYIPILLFLFVVGIAFMGAGLGNKDFGIPREVAGQADANQAGNDDYDCNWDGAPAKLINDIKNASSHYGVDQALLASIYLHESASIKTIIAGNFTPEAWNSAAINNDQKPPDSDKDLAKNGTCSTEPTWHYGSSGEYGPFQFMPETWDGIAAQFKNSNPNLDPWKFHDAALAAAFHIKGIMDGNGISQGDTSENAIKKIASIYNGGRGGCHKPQAQNYAEEVWQAFQILQQKCQTGAGWSLAFPPAANSEAAKSCLANFLTVNRSPLKNYTQNFITEGAKPANNVNPAFMLAISFHESSWGINQCGRRAMANNKETYNYFCLTATGNEQKTERPIGGSYYRAFNSWEEAVAEQANYLQRRYFSQGAKTINDVWKGDPSGQNRWPAYAKPGEPNDIGKANPRWGPDITRAMSDIITKCPAFKPV